MADKMKALGAYRPRVMKTWQVVSDPYPDSTMKELAPRWKEEHSESPVHQEGRVISERSSCQKIE